MKKLCNVQSSTQKNSPSREEYEALLFAVSKTAGSETWKTRAGRNTGPDHFIPSDAWQYFKISMQYHVRKKHDSTLVCPVCMDVPFAENGWYCTKSCNHSVCKQCLRSYAQNLLSDPSHSGPLKCPCCPRLLRQEDAIVALSLDENDNEIATKKENKITKKKNFTPRIKHNEDTMSNAVILLEKWQKKALHETLRGMDDYRPCPNCQTTINADNEINNSGGGFVTDECLASINEDRQSNAQFFVRLAETGTTKAVLITYALYYLYRCNSTVNSSELRQIITTILPVIGLSMFMAFLNLTIVSITRKQIMRPIPVTCPCCDVGFNLPSTEIDMAKKSNAHDESEMATQRWKNVNTRACPRCHTPIQKHGGCNHVKCIRCQTEFCWACMRARTRCRAYNCENGAPYGGAGHDPTQERLEHFTLMERIDRLEYNAREQLRLFPRPELLLPLLYWLFHFAGLDSWIGATIWWFLSILARATFQLSRVICIMVLLWATSNHCRNWLTRRDNRTFRTESDMVVEALSRSMRDY